MLSSLAYGFEQGEAEMQEKIEGYIAITIDVTARPNELKAPLVNQVGARLYKTRASCEAELMKRLPKLEGYQPTIDKGVGNNLFLHSYKKNPYAKDSVLICMKTDLYYY